MLYENRKIDDRIVFESITEEVERDVREVIDKIKKASKWHPLPFTAE